MTSINQPAVPTGKPWKSTWPACWPLWKRGWRQALSPYGLIALEFKLLKFCLRQEECTATQLAEVLPTDPARISRLVNGLVETGFLSRGRLTSDRRIVMLSLTEAGRERILESDRAIQEFFEVLAEGISAEARGAFVSIAVTMTVNYEARRLRE